VCDFSDGAFRGNCFCTTTFHLSNTYVCFSHTLFSLHHATYYSSRRDYTRAVDTWALGVIVFVLLCGCLPFDDDSAMVPSDDLVKAKFVLRFPRWAKNLSASAKNLLSHLLDVNPRTRYTAEQALEHPWVRGETAPKGNLLASPGRIKQSPAIIGSAKNGRYNKAGGAAGRKNPNLTPPAPSGPIKRKGSI